MTCLLKNVIFHAYCENLLEKTKQKIMSDFPATRTHSRDVFLNLEMQLLAIVLRIT